MYLSSSCSCHWRLGITRKLGIADSRPFILSVARRTLCRSLTSPQRGLSQRPFDDPVGIRTTRSLSLKVSPKIGEFDFFDDNSSVVYRAWKRSTECLPTLCRLNPSTSTGQCWLYTTITPQKQNNKNILSVHDIAATKKSPAAKHRSRLK